MADPKTAGKFKGVALPVILSANDLLDGQVVFLTATGWTYDPAKAQIADDEPAAQALDERGQAAARQNLVVDPYLVAVERSADGLPIASHFREAIRQTGPSIHPEYGKQADFPSVRQR